MISRWRASRLCWSFNAMIKKLIPLLLSAVISLYLSAGADWRTDVSVFLGKTGDYQKAADYLINHFESLSEIEKSTACGLLAYSFHKLNDKNNAYKWLGEYFEKYGGYNLGFHFLDGSTQMAVTEFLLRWQSKYPLVTEMGFIDRGDFQSLSAPDQLVIGLEMASDAYFKLSDENQVLKGGLFLKGYNSFSLETGGLFEEGGTRRYFLELKVDDFIVRREVEISAQSDSYLSVKKVESETKNYEYLISMYIGDELVAFSKKLSPAPPPLKIDVPLGKGVYQPFGPVKKDDPFMNSFSIQDAVAVIYQTIKELTKGKGKELSEPVRAKQQVTVNFKRRNSQGLEEEVKIFLTLKKGSVRFLAL